jgi:hypothetical protein
MGENHKTHKIITLIVWGTWSCDQKTLWEIFSGVGGHLIFVNISPTKHEGF